MPKPISANASLATTPRPASKTMIKLPLEFPLGFGILIIQSGWNYHQSCYRNQQALTNIVKQIDIQCFDETNLHKLTNSVFQIIYGETVSGNMSQ